MAKVHDERALKAYLSQLSREALVKHLLHLGKLFPDVGDYLRLLMHPADEKKVRAKYKDVIRHEFFPARGYGSAQLSVARKAIADYRKLASTEEGLADIMLFYVEMGVRYTLEYGDIDEGFYESMEKMYESVLKHIVKHGLEKGFRARCEHLVEATQGIGWGFHDTLGEMFDRYIGEVESE